MIVEERAPTRTSAQLAVEEHAPGWAGALPAVVGALAAAAVTELVLMRTFYRVGIFIPKRGTFPIVYSTLTAIGSFALNLSSVLVLVALAMFAARGIRVRGESAGWALAAFVAMSVLLVASGEHRLGPVARLVFVLSVASVAWPFVRSPGPRLDRLAVAGVSVIALVGTYAGLGSDAGLFAPASPGPGGVVGAELAAEALTLATALALFAAWIVRCPRPAPVVAGVVAGAGLLVLWSANGAITGILVLWTVGLRMYLPVWLYALALGAFTAAAAGERRGAPWRSIGMSLLFVGGTLFGSTYAQALVLAGLVLLTGAYAVGGLGAAPAGSADGGSR